MGQILNDAKSKYKTKKTLIQTLIDNSPLTDSDFNEIVEAYDSTEQEAMGLMIYCTEGRFDRDADGGWTFEPNN